MKSPTLMFPAVVAAAVVAAVSPVGAQQAKDILDTAVEKYEQRMQGIENYTVVFEILGTSVTTYFERSTVDGHTVFVPASANGTNVTSARATDPWRDMSRIGDRASLTGRKDIDGVSTYEIRIDDPEDLDFGRSLVESQQKADFTLKRMTMWVDTKDYVIRRMEMVGEMARDGQTNPITTTMDMLDYRNVKGVLHPFRTVINMQGIAEAADISDEDLARARESLAKLETEMAKMSESQRNMMQRVMGNQLEKLRGIIESGGTQLEMDVKELRVNAGPPGTHLPSSAPSSR